MPSSPPVPTSAVFDSPSKTLTVAFDQPLQPGTSAAGNWAAWPANIRHANTIPIVVSGNTVSGVLAQQFPDTKSNVVQYFGSPPDVVGLNGLPVAAFADFPLTVV